MRKFVRNILVSALTATMTLSGSIGFAAELEEINQTEIETVLEETSAEEEILPESNIVTEEYLIDGDAETDGVIASGTCGTPSWVLYDDGTLVISGAGTVIKDPVSHIQYWNGYRDSIKYLRVEEGITAIDDGMFYDYNLIDVQLPQGLNTIGNDAFFSCDQLTSISLPSGLTSIKNYAFGHCSNLSDIQLPDGLKSIGSSAFTGCNITNILIPDSVTNIESYAFSGCSKLEKIAWPSGLYQIPDYVFSGCTSLSSIIVPKSVTYIWLGAFDYCSALTDVYYGGSEKDWTWIPVGDYNVILSQATIHFTEENTPNSITLDQTEINRSYNAIPEDSWNYPTLTATFDLPKYAYDDAIVTSSNPEIVSVELDGTNTDSHTKTYRLKPLDFGTSTITVSTADGSVSASCVVNIEQYIDINELNISDHNITLNEGKSYTLSCTTSPENATVSSIVWQSGDQNVATVDENGVVTAHNLGSTWVDVIYNNSYSTRCYVNVIKPATALTLSQDSITLDVNHVIYSTSFNLYATIEPEDSNVTIVWESKNPDVAYIDYVYGNWAIINASAPGTTTITATTSDGTLSASCEVTVIEGVGLEDVILSDTELYLKAGETHQLSYTVQPEDATISSVSWYSDFNQDAVSVDENGLVTANQQGGANICLNINGIERRCYVEVYTPLTGLSINEDSITLDVAGDGYRNIWTTRNPDNSSEALNWESSDTSIVDFDYTCNDYATVKPIGVGTATITVTNLDGSLSDTCEVKVTDNSVKVPVEKLTFDKHELTYDASTDNRPSLSLKIEPENADYSEVKFSLDNEQVIGYMWDIWNEGRDYFFGLEFVDRGTATITVSNKDGSITDSCTVKVITSETLPEKLVLSDTALTLNKNTVAKLKATPDPLPQNPGRDQNPTIVYWESSDPDIVEVTSTGTVFAVGTGKASVTARFEYYYGVVRFLVLTASCDITVKEDDGSASQTPTPINNYTTIISSGGLSLDKYGLDLKPEESSKLTATTDSSSKTVTWSSSNDAIATVDKSGTVTAKASGIAVITAVGSKQTDWASCIVVVQESKEEEPGTDPSDVAVESVDISEESLILSAGETKALTATVSPEDAANKKVLWISTDTEIASVNQNGVVTAKTAGATSIIAVSSDLETSDVCNVLVKEATYDGAITGLKAVPAGMHKVLVSWDKTEGADGYLILRGGKQIGYSITNSYTDNSADADDFNYYWVIPYVRQNGKTVKGQLSNYVWALGRTVGQVQKVTTQAGADGVRLTWDSVEGANGYVILSKTGSAKAAFNPKVTVTGTTYTDKATAGIQFYWVYAVYNNADGKTLAAGKVSPYAWAVAK